LRAEKSKEKELEECKVLARKISTKVLKSFWGKI
jgi:hypothetical protein